MGVCAGGMWECVEGGGIEVACFPMNIIGKKDPYILGHGISDGSRPANSHGFTRV